MKFQRELGKEGSQICKSKCYFYVGIFDFFFKDRFMGNSFLGLVYEDVLLLLLPIKELCGYQIVIHIHVSSKLADMNSLPSITCSGVVEKSEVPRFLVFVRRLFQCHPHII